MPFLVLWTGKGRVSELCILESDGAKVSIISFTELNFVFLFCVEH